MKPHLKDLKFKTELPVCDGSVKIEYDGEYLIVYSKDKDGVLLGENYESENLSYNAELEGFSLAKGVVYKIKVKR